MRVRDARQFAEELTDGSDFRVPFARSFRGFLWVTRYPIAISLAAIGLGESRSAYFIAFAMAAVIFVMLLVFVPRFRGIMRPVEESLAENAAARGRWWRDKFWGSPARLSFCAAMIGCVTLGAAYLAFANRDADTWGFLLMGAGLFGLMRATTPPEELRWPVLFPSPYRKVRRERKMPSRAGVNSGQVE